VPPVAIIQRYFSACTPQDVTSVSCSTGLVLGFRQRRCVPGSPAETSLPSTGSLNEARRTLINRTTGHRSCVAAPAPCACAPCPATDATPTVGPTHRLVRNRVPAPSLPHVHPISFVQAPHRSWVGGAKAASARRRSAGAPRHGRSSVQAQVRFTALTKLGITALTSTEAPPSGGTAASSPWRRVPAPPRPPLKVRFHRLSHRTAPLPYLTTLPGNISHSHKSVTGHTLTVRGIPLHLHRRRYAAARAVQLCKGVGLQCCEQQRSTADAGVTPAAGSHHRDLGDGRAAASAWPARLAARQPLRGCRRVCRQAAEGCRQAA
jgi:hypothetical protein